jgi:hypothetical protein
MCDPNRVSWIVFPPQVSYFRKLIFDL